MKPSLSYVRGLRDVLEISSKNERREYLKREDRMLSFSPLLSVTGSIIASTTLSLGMTLGRNLNNSIYTVAGITSAALSFIPLVVFPLYNLGRYESKRKGIEKSSSLNRNIVLGRLSERDVSLGKFALDKF